MIIQQANRIQDIKSYYFARKLAEIKQMNQTGDAVINLGIGSPDLNPPIEVMQRLQSAIEESGAHQYQPYRGIDQLRKSFANWYQKKFQVDLNFNTEILPLIGSKEGIMHISMAFLNKGDQVLVPNPGYPAYSTISKICGAEPLFYHLNPENNWYPDFQKLSNIDLSRVKIMWVNYPHMPTGAKPTKALFQELVDFGIEHNILICHDNPYSLLLNDEPISILQVKKAKAVALELTSLSKNYNMSGWRVGGISGAKEYIDTILKFKSNMDSGMFYAVQQSAIKALEIGQSWQEELNKVYQKRRQKAWQIMDILQCEYNQDTAGIFVWGRVKNENQTGESISNYLLDKARVFITPGFIFGSNGQSYIRISLCSPVKTFEKAIHRIQSIRLNNK